MLDILVEMTLGGRDPGAETGSGTVTGIVTGAGVTGPGHVTGRGGPGRETDAATAAETKRGAAPGTGRGARGPGARAGTERGGGRSGRGPRGAGTSSRSRTSLRTPDTRASTTTRACTSSRRRWRRRRRVRTAVVSRNRGATTTTAGLIIRHYTKYPGEIMNQQYTVHFFCFYKCASQRKILGMGVTKLNLPFMMS